jgi:hypothetical protein
MLIRYGYSGISRIWSVRSAESGGDSPPETLRERAL